MEPRTGRTWTILVVAAAAVGLGVALYLTRLHLELLYGSGVGSSLCDFSANINCSAVNASTASEIFGIPQSVLAIPAYVIALLLGVSAGVRRDGRYALALAALGLLAVLYSARLAWISATVIGAWCLFCMALYLVNFALLVLGVVGSGASMRALPKELALLPVRAPIVMVATLCVGLVVLGSAYGAYTEVRGVMVADAAAKAIAPPAAAPTANANTKGSVDNGTKPVKLAAATIEVVPPADAPTWGPKNAKVSIVEWSDFQCPFCKRLSGSLRQLVQEHPNDVRLTYVQDPLNLDCSHAKLQKTMHPEACGAASAGVCADKQGKFWPMHDALFDRQGELGRKTYLEIAGDLGLDRAAFEKCLDDPATHDKLLSDTDLGVKFGVSGTPTFFVNGRKMAGAQPIEVLRAVVDAELAGNKAALDLQVAVGTEETGTVTANTDVVPITALGVGRDIDAFEASLDGGKAVSRPGVEPARNVSWFEARDACALSGRRLCTEREWLAACTGTAPVDADRNGISSDDPILGRKYGYGDDRHAGACADSRMPDDTRPVLTGNHPKCGTPDGIYDLVGGVKEWVGLTPATAATKGGSYSSGESARCGYYRDDMAPEAKEAATGFRCCSGQPDPEPPFLKPGRDVGETMASFEVPLLDGGALESKKLSGRPTVVTFWASWCGPCQKEMPALAKLYDGYRDEGLDVLAISVDTDESKLRAWLEKNPMPFPIARDPGGKLMDTFTNRGLPTTLWIKKDGTIRLRTTGLPPGAEKRLNELAAELVGVDPKPELVADATRPPLPPPKQ